MKVTGGDIRTTHLDRNPCNSRDFGHGHTFPNAFSRGSLGLLAFFGHCGQFGRTVFLVHRRFGTHNKGKGSPCHPPRHLCPHHLVAQHLMLSVWRPRLLPEAGFSLWRETSHPSAGKAFPPGSFWIPSKTCQRAISRVLCVLCSVFPREGNAG